MVVSDSVGRVPAVATVVLCVALALLSMLGCCSAQPDILWPNNNPLPATWHQSGNLWPVPAFNRSILFFSQTSGWVGGPMDFGTKGIYLFFCFIYPPNWTYNVSFGSSTSSYPVFNSSLGVSSCSFSASGVTVNLLPSPSYWGCVSMLIMNDDRIAVYTFDAQFWPVDHYTLPFNTRTYDLTSINISGSGPKVPLTLPPDIPSLPIFFGFMSRPACSISNCSLCQNQATCKTCDAGFVLGNDGGECLPAKCSLVSNYWDKDCRTKRPCKSYFNEVACAPNDCYWCPLTSSCSDKPCVCGDLDLVGCQLNTETCTNCFSTLECMNASEYPQKCACDLASSQGDCAFPCTWCPQSGKCVETEMKCDNCSDFQLKGTCEQKGCHWCPERDQCTSEPSWCFRCEFGIQKVFCEHFSHCSWSQTEEVCFPVGTSRNITTQCSELNRTTCGDSKCTWCGTLSRCATRAECFTCPVLSQIDCKQASKCMWSETFTVCVSVDSSELFRYNCSMISSVNPAFCAKLPGCLDCGDGICLKRGNVCPANHKTYAEIIGPICAVGGALLITGAIFGFMYGRKRMKLQNKSSEDKDLDLATRLGRDPGPSYSAEDFGITLNPSSLAFGQLDVDVKKSVQLEIKRISKKLPFSGSQLILTSPPKPQFTFTADATVINIPEKEGESIVVELTLEAHCTTVIKNVELLLIKEDFGHVSIPFSGDVLLSTKLDWDEIQLTQKLGQGGYAVVHKGKWRGNDVAVKVPKDMAPITKEDVEREVMLMTRIRSPFLVTFYGTACREKTVSYVLECAPLGSLTAHLNSEKLLPVGFQIKVALDCAQGMNVLHSNGVIHRDLKPDNILLYSLSDSASVVAKLTDFGTAKFVGQEERKLEHTVGVGTPIYMAPELIDAQPYSSAADVFSFSITLLQMITATVPYKDFANSWAITAFVLNGDRLPVPDHPLKPTIEAGWAPKPEDRPSFADMIPSLSSLHKS